jgi:hypothetical protein
VFAVAAEFMITLRCNRLRRNWAGGGGVAMSGLTYLRRRCGLAACLAYGRSLVRFSAERSCSNEDIRDVLHKIVHSGKESHQYYKLNFSKNHFQNVFTTNEKD